MNSSDENLPDAGAPRSAPRAASVAARRLEGASLYRQRRFAEAAAAFSAWAQQEPEEALAALSAARALFLAGERRAAEAACRSAVGRDPTLLRGHLLLARMALAENRLGQAQAHLRDAVASRPERSSLRAMLARVMMRRSRFEAAAKAAEAALAHDPASHSAARVLAELHIVNGEAGKATAILSELERQCPDWGEPRILREELRRKRELPRAISAEPTPVERQPPIWEEGGGAEPRGEPPRLAERPGGTLSAVAGPAIAALSPVPAFGQTDFFDHIFQIYALILRELRLHYRGTRLGFLLEYIRPSLVMMLHYMIFTAINKYMPAKIPVELFIIGSFTPWYATSHVIRATMGTKRHAADMPGVTEIHLGVARMVWEFFSMFSFCIFCVAMLALIGWPEPIPNIPATVVNFALAVCLGLGFGLILQALARVFPSMDMLKKAVLWILFITSGHYFSISGGRQGLWVYIWFNPCLHLAELQRHAFDPGYPTQLVTVWYPTAVAAGLVIMGLMLNRWTRQLGYD